MNLRYCSFIFTLPLISATRNSGGGRVQGTFSTTVDFPNLQLTPVLDGATCLAQAPILFGFEGDFVAQVSSTASVHLSIDCDSVVAGETGVDTFLATAEFAGFIDTELIVGSFSFSGFTGDEGDVQGKVTIDGAYAGQLDMTGLVNVGGTYKGRLRRTV